MKNKSLVLKILENDKGGKIVLSALAVIVFVVSFCNLFIPADSIFHVSTFTVTILGKYLAFALLALALGNLQFRREISFAPISSLSGGERLKIALVALKFQTVELLLLDEPDNHLDIESRELLARAIRSFHGSVILVSHDELFVKECGIEESYLLN